TPKGGDKYPVTSNCSTKVELGNHLSALRVSFDPVVGGRSTADSRFITDSDRWLGGH
ncbi:hypothetical protein AVEN_11051-1, partial [Araneus ventricosus]